MTETTIFDKTMAFNLPFAVTTSLANLSSQILYRFVLKVLVLAPFALFGSLGLSQYNEREGGREFNLYNFYTVGLLNNLQEKFNEFKHSTTSESRSPDRVSNLVLKAIKDGDNVTLKRHLVDPETGHFTRIGESEKSFIRRNQVSIGLPVTIMDDKITLIPYAFDMRIKTCSKLEQYSVPLVLDRVTVVGDFLVKCYSHYKIFTEDNRGGLGTEAPVPFFKTKIQDCPNPNAKFVYLDCDVAKISIEHRVL